MKLELVLEILRNTSNVEMTQQNNTLHSQSIIDGHDVKVTVQMVGGMHGYVQFEVDGSLELQKDLPPITAMKILQYVISSLKTFSNNNDHVEFYFGADAEHEQVYDKLLPRLSSRFGFKIEKQPYNMDKSEIIQRKLIPLYDKKHSRMTCVYFLTRT